MRLDKRTFISLVEASKREAFVSGLVEGAGWDRQRAVEVEGGEERQ